MSRRPGNSGGTDSGCALADRFVEVDGHRVYTLTGGTGPSLVLVHGLTGSTANWRRNFDALSRHATVYAIDLPNMGRSDRVTGLDAGLAATSDRLAATMDALGVAQADVAGHSHGGAVVMMLAARHPARVRSMILFGPANPYSHAGDLLIRWYSSAPGRLMARAAPYLPRWLQTIALGRMYGDPSRITEGTLDGYVEGLRTAGTVAHVVCIVRGWFAEMAELEAVLPQLRSTPALLVWGDRDRAVSLASGRRLHQELPESKLIVVASAGHVVFEEMPREANVAMLDWLTRGGTMSAVSGYAVPERQVALPGAKVSGLSVAR